MVYRIVAKSRACLANVKRPRSSFDEALVRVTAYREWFRLRIYPATLIARDGANNQAQIKPDMLESFPGYIGIFIV